MGIFGHKVFDPLSQTPLAEHMETAKPDAPEQLFIIDRSGAKATARLTSEGLVVLAGSIIRKEIMPSCPGYVKTAREDNKDFIDASGVLQRDILFKTPSGAASFVLGSPANGNIEWHTADRKRFKDVEAKEIID